MLQVFTGTDLGQLNYVAGDDDSFFSLDSAVTFWAPAGQVFAIQIDSYCSRSAGYFNLNINSAYAYPTSEDSKK